MNIIQELEQEQDNQKIFQQVSDLQKKVKQEYIFNLEGFKKVKNNHISYG